MLTLRDALESALVENPDDVATHFAYADYLQERGDPRGEFIQLQLALEDRWRTPMERQKLQALAGEMLQDHERDWLGILADELLGSESERDWACSFLAPAPTEHGFARGWLDRLVLRDSPEYARRIKLGPLLCLAPEARLLRELVLEYDDGLVEALRDACLLNLRVFQLGKSMTRFQDLPWVAESPSVPALIAAFPHLEELRLFAKDYAAHELFSLPNLSSLRILEVHYLSARYPLEALAGNPALGKLSHLLLDPHPFLEPCIDLAGVRAIVQSPHLVSLTHLHLHRSDLGDVGCSEIVTSGILKRLQVLDLRHGEITDTGARILADCPDLRRLERLDVERNGLTQTGIDSLRRVLGPNLHAEHQQTPNELAQRQYLYEADLE
jgi:uncharacterized protein (TIGR02996 family)